MVMVAQVAESPCAFWKSKVTFSPKGSSQSILKALRSGIQSGMLHQLADANRELLTISAAKKQQRRMQAQRKKQPRSWRNRRRQSGQQLRRRQRRQPGTNDE